MTHNNETHKNHPQKWDSQKSSTKMKLTKIIHKNVQKCFETDLQKEIEENTVLKKIENKFIRNNILETLENYRIYILK